MHILHICAYSWATGGPPKVIFDHAEVALSRGHAVTILSPISPGEVMYPLPTGATLVTVPRREPVSRIFREFAPAMIGYLRINRGRFDVIHMHGLWHFGVLLPFLLPDNQAVRVVTVHGVLDRWTLRTRYWKKWLMSGLFQKNHLRRADLIHVLTEEEAADVRQHVGHDLPRMVVVPNGVRTADFAGLPPRGQAWSCSCPPLPTMPVNSPMRCWYWPGPMMDTKPKPVPLLANITWRIGSNSSVC
jgi:glycosyltransferase involved in cell wall biosynthesis